MSYWAGFYERLFNFKEVRYFDIKGEYTGLTSKAMSAPDGQIRIPLNEESSKGSGQVEEFLMQFNGEGIQHIALYTDDLLKTFDHLKAAGLSVELRRQEPGNFSSIYPYIYPRKVPRYQAARLNCIKTKFVGSLINAQSGEILSLRQFMCAPIPSIESSTLAP